MKLVYQEDFAGGPGAWTTGKAVPDGSWHRNVLGERGDPVSLGWSRTGGQDGGHSYARSPWYFDDNHGEFAWLYLAFIINRSSLIGLDGRDLREARIDLTIRGHEFDAKDTELLFWVQGAPEMEGGASVYNWALTSQPVGVGLADGLWHGETVTLVNDETKWTFMGHLSGGLANKIRVVQDLSASDGMLDGILKGGHVNFGFLLCGVDANDPPTGRIDLDRVTISIRE